MNADEPSAAAASADADVPAGAQPAGGAHGVPAPVTFPQIARLELDELLEQLVERAHDVLNTQGRLRGLLAATQSISTDLSLPDLLRRIVQSACELVGAKYGALGVIGTDKDLSEFVTIGVGPEVITAIGRFPHGEGVLGKLITDPRPLRLNEITDHAESVGFPAAHPVMHSFLGVPIRVGEQVYGNLYLTEKEGEGGFTADDEELLTALASAAGVAIDNARLYELERRRRGWQTAAAEISGELLGGERDPLPLIAKRAREVADADFAALVLPVPDDDELLRVAAADGVGAQDVRGRLIPREGSLSGQALAENADLVVADVGSTDRTVDTPGVPDGPAILVRIPEAGEGQAGILSLARSRGSRIFDRDEQDMIAAFADQAGVALKLAHAQDARRRLLLLEDRDRIARDLHDHVIQRLFAAGLGLTGLAARTEDPSVRQRLTGYTDQLDDTIQAIRQTIFALQRHRETGVQAAILQIARDAAGALGFNPDLRFEGPLDAMIDKDMTDHVTAIVREGLANAARHAKANTVSANLSVADGQHLTITISDDGVGIGDPDHVSGLGNMRARADQLGGSFTVVSPTLPDGGGTRIEWVVPLHRAAE